MRDHLSPIFYSGTSVILRFPQTELNVSGWHALSVSCPLSPFLSTCRVRVTCIVSRQDRQDRENFAPPLRSSAEFLMPSLSLLFVANLVRLGTRDASQGTVGFVKRNFSTFSRGIALVPCVASTLTAPLFIPQVGPSNAINYSA